MAAKFRATAETRVGNGNFGKFVIDIDIDSFAPETDFFLEVIDPVGTTIKEITVSPDYTSPGVLPGGWADDVIEVDIPVSGTQYISGTYTFKINDGTDDYQATHLFCFHTKPDGTSVGGILTGVVDCEQATLTFTDNTDHVDWTVLTRSMVIVPPAIPNQAAPSPITSLLAEYSLSFSYTNVTYTAANTVTRSQTSTSSDWEFVAKETITSSESTFVDCGQGICDIVLCLHDYVNNLTSKANSAGGFGNLNEKVKGEALQYFLWISLYQTLSACGEHTKAQGWRDMLLEKFDCGCGCTGTTVSNSTPKPYNP